LALFQSDTQGDAAVERDAFELHVETFAVGVRPCYATSRPVAFLSLAVPDHISNVCRGFAGGFRFGVGIVGHDLFLLLLNSGPAHHSLPAPSRSRKEQAVLFSLQNGTARKSFQDLMRNLSDTRIEAAAAA
jgi:hypothetical protein